MIRQDYEVSALVVKVAALNGRYGRYSSLASQRQRHWKGSGIGLATSGVGKVGYAGPPHFDGQSAIHAS